MKSRHFLILLPILLFGCDNASTSSGGKMTTSQFSSLLEAPIGQKVQYCMANRFDPDCLRAQAWNCPLDQERPIKAKLLGPENCPGVVYEDIAFPGKKFCSLTGQKEREEIIPQNCQVQVTG